MEKLSPTNKIIGICRIRNEEHIIWDTLNHVAQLVDEIVVYDDASTDNTVELCLSHPAVVAVKQNKKWEKDSIARNAVEGDYRQEAYIEALKHGANWIYCFDADEFADFEGIDFTADAYRLRLFDFYITPEDKNKTWRERKWMGPEYRDILMLFKVQDGIRFFQREPVIPTMIATVNQGFVKHYGKAISTAQWEETCNYYVNHRGNSLDPQLIKFKKKWEKRKGKAIHKGISDFGYALIEWKDKEKKGFLLTPKIDK
ncbi:MAG TPA: glycosyltransferase [Candidatus Moranbacteria bacterium]|nr:glycosyltransferase [Candidatus Moranbacteria bacterium]